ncbi:hypothetical protein Poli38472_014868 [Pythium oligandrum]|uniref:Uncharacterized protein n=1 Tax=Pythium oligandrum TaxID=41045 RepID=A0A8K1C1Z2_PYTOL|nr:hypothetical protein Poli38472_014868 [Pythium oligandrum]|eukprot:TMW54934.1 hypothetical protein Poli38472_014868 [Pythium oligandrum]
MPDPTAIPSFLWQQLPLLYNMIAPNRLSGHSMSKPSGPLSASFLQSFAEFFASRKVTIELVFMTICWVKSVSALQGDAGLSRNVSRTIYHRWKLQDRLEKLISKGDAVPTMQKSMKKMLDDLKDAEKGDMVIRANPVLAGFVELDLHLLYLHVGNESVFPTPHFRGFCHLLMGMLRDSKGPLDNGDAGILKTMVNRNPALLGISASTTGARASDLDILLHHAAAGPARDKRTVEWMIQCGALYLQPTHCRNPPEPGTLDRGVVRKQLCNHLAVHSAAAAGLEDVMRLLLEADHLRDLNTRTFHTKESLAHLTVKNGHRGVYELLERLGADVRHPDAKGKYVYDLTSDASWKESIRALAEKQRRDYDSKGERKYVRANVTLAKLLSKLGKQREDAKSASPSNGKPAQTAPPPAPTTTQSENSTTKSVKKKKKKKGKEEASGHPR